MRQGFKKKERGGGRAKKTGDARTGPVAPARPCWGAPRGPLQTRYFPQIRYCLRRRARGGRANWVFAGFDPFFCPLWR